ncbi:MAG: N-acetylneuraminic acid mutarotase [Paraglaciecola sp.]|jgi:N-acetylneuraminic acid mutarotase
MFKHSIAKCFFVLCLIPLLGLGGCASHVPVGKAPGALSEGDRQPSATIPPPTLTLNTARFSHATATDGHKLYVFAGYGKTGFLTDVEIIDPQSGKIEVLTNKVLPRRYFSAVWDGEHSIYLLGGISHIGDSIALESTVEIFDTITHEITFTRPVPMARHNSSAVYLDGQIYLLGGSDYSVANGFELIPSTLATRYDPPSQTWLPVADMLTAKATRVFAKDGLIYALGGSRFMAPMTVFEQYNPRQNNWQNLPALPLPLSAHSLVVYGQKLLVFGSDDVPDLTYSYDFELATWQKTDIDYLPSSQNTATLLGNTVYVIGGTGGKGKAFVDYIQQFPQ